MCVYGVYVYVDCYMVYVVHIGCVCMCACDEVYIYVGI